MADAQRPTPAGQESSGVSGPYREPIASTFAPSGAWTGLPLSPSTAATALASSRAATTRWLTQ
jgi:hypothetical protein